MPVRKPFGCALQYDGLFGGVRAAPNRPVSPAGSSFLDTSSEQQVDARQIPDGGSRRPPCSGVGYS